VSKTGRPREFEEQAVLDVVMDVFWTKGYSGTSMQDLVDRTGVKRQSLYGAFGDKDRLFLLALQRYTEGASEVRRALSGPGPVLPALRAFLLASLDAARELPGRGCLLGNTVAELVPGHHQATIAAQEAYADLQRIFTEAIERGRAAGEIRTDHAVIDQASTLLMAMQGLRLLSRAQPDLDRLAGAVDVVIDGFARRS
jgi:TetR/AcrR family transcriptional repressor of nem operon